MPDASRTTALNASGGALREAGRVEEDPVGRVVVGADDRPVRRVADLDRERDLGELRIGERGADLDLAHDGRAVGRGGDA